MCQQHSMQLHNHKTVNAMSSYPTQETEQIEGGWFRSLMCKKHVLMNILKNLGQNVVEKCPITDG